MDENKREEVLTVEDLERIESSEDKVVARSVFIEGKGLMEVAGSLGRSTTFIYASMKRIKEAFFDPEKSGLVIAPKKISSLGKSSQERFEKRKKMAIRKLFQIRGEKIASIEEKIGKAKAIRGECIERFLLSEEEYFEILFRAGAVLKEVEASEDIRKVIDGLAESENRVVDAERALAKNIEMFSRLRRRCMGITLKFAADKRKIIESKYSELIAFEEEEEA